jgi:serine/threonine protein kinase
MLHGRHQNADIWSCGVILYSMLVGQYPFERPEDKAKGVTEHQKLQNVMKVGHIATLT